MKSTNNFKIALFFLTCFFGLKLLGQKVGLAIDDQVDPSVITVVPKSNVVVVSRAEVIDESSLGAFQGTQKLSIDQMFKLRAFDRFEKVVQVFPQMLCENKYSSPLDLRCFSCSYPQSNMTWNLGFHRKAVGDQSCELATINIETNQKEQFESLRTNFIEQSESQFNIDYTKSGNRWIAGTKTEDFQVFLQKKFNDGKNTFEEFLNLQIQFIFSLANQQKIDNAIGTMASALKGIPEKAKTEFVELLFSEDSGSKKSLWEKFVHKQKNTETSEGEKETDVGSVDEKKFQSDQSLDFLRSIVFHRSIKSKAEYLGCYDRFLKSLLPLEVDEAVATEFQGIGYLKVVEMKKPSEGANSSSIKEAKAPAEGKAAVDGTANEGNSEESKPSSTVNNKNYQVDFSKPPSLAKNICGLSSVEEIDLGQLELRPLCAQLGERVSSFEMKYKKFFKGEDKPDFKLYRSYLVSQLMLANESRYFYELDKLALINKMDQPSNENVKEQSQVLDLALSKSVEYQEELENLLPYLGLALKERKDWLIKGIKSARAFQLCRVN